MSDTSEEWRGRVGGMSEEEMEAFLAGGSVMRLACLDDGGDPYLRPMLARVARRVLLGGAPPAVEVGTVPSA